MTSRREPAVFAKVYQLYLAKAYHAALELLEEYHDSDPFTRRKWFEWRVSLAARAGNLDQAETILAEALDDGHFFTEFTLRQNEDLAALQGRPRFEELVRRSQRMLNQAQQQASMKLELVEPAPPSASPAPLIVGLHGNNSNAKRFLEYWQHLSPQGWCLAFPQSSMVSGKDVYVWNDLPLAEKELRVHYQAITYKYPVDESRTIIAGFSKGGQVALQAAFKQLFPIRGFIAVAPFIGDPDAFFAALNVQPGSPLRGYFLLGEKDEMCTAGALKLHQQLSEAGVPCGVEVFPGIGHEFPADNVLAIQRALDFIFAA